MPVAIDLGSRVIHLVVGETSGETIKLSQAKILKLPAEVIGEEAKRFEALEPLLKATLKDFGLKRDTGAITISFSRFLLRDLELPNGKPEEIRQMARQELIHFSNVSELDIVEVRRLEGRHLPEDRVSVQAAAMHRPLVDSFYQLLEGIGLKPGALSLHNNALAALIADKPLVNGLSLADRTVLFLDLGMEATLVQIASDGHLIVSRHLPVGFAELDRIISGGLGRAIEEAAEIRQSTFNLGTESPSYHALGLSAQQQLELFMSRLTEELNKITRFFASSIGRGTPIECVYLYGAGAEVKGLLERLESALNYRVEVVRSFSNVSQQGTATEIPQQHLLNACGALRLL